MAEGKPDRELEEAAREGRFEDEGWRLRRDRSRFWASVVITALRDRQGTLRGFGKVTRDLTARREAEEARRELAAREAAEEERRRADQVQERLVSIVGHDLRTPLSVIAMGVSAIRQRGGLGPEQLATLERIARSSQRMQGIIDDLLDFGRARQVAVSVHNRGAPIPPEEVPRLFEPFRQGEGPAAGERSGSVGLGLFIVREVVRAHGGEVEVRSEASAGTTFTVRLPRGASMPR